MQESGEQTERDADSGEEASSHPAPSLGTRLKIAREAKALALEKIADELRIDAHVLRALEEDRIEDIGVAPVFIKGYLQQYGRRLDLNYGELRAAYLAQIGREDVELLPSRVIRLRDERQITIWIIAALVLLLLGVFLFVWWLGYDEPGFGAAAPAARPRVETVAPVLAPPPAPAVREGAEADVGEDAAPNVEPVVSPPAAQTVPLTVRSANTAATAAPIEDGAALITLTFREQSWAEITAGDGRQLFYDLGSAGSATTVAAPLPVSVLLGNAEGVDIAVDGVPFAIPRQGRRGNIANFVITPASE